MIHVYKIRNRFLCLNLIIYFWQYSVFFEYTRVQKHLMTKIMALGSESFIPLKISIICVVLYFRLNS